MLQLFMRARGDTHHEVRSSGCHVQLGEEAAAAVAKTAELVRGYEDVKLRGLHAYKARRAELGYPIGAPLTDLLDD